MEYIPAMKPLVSILLLILLIQGISFAQEQYADTLLLKSGELLTGKIVTYPPVGESVVITHPGMKYNEFLMDNVAGIYMHDGRLPLPKDQMPDPSVSFFASAIIPGLGQYLNGEPIKGAIFFGIEALFIGTALSMLPATGYNLDWAIGPQSSIMVALVFAGITHVIQMFEAPLHASAVRRKTSIIYPDETLQRRQERLGRRPRRGTTSSRVLGFEVVL